MDNLQRFLEYTSEIDGQVARIKADLIAGNTRDDELPAFVSNQLYALWKRALEMGVQPEDPIGGAANSLKRRTRKESMFQKQHSELCKTISTELTKAPDLLGQGPYCLLALDLESNIVYETEGECGYIDGLLGEAQNLDADSCGTFAHHLIDASSLKPCILIGEQNYMASLAHSVVIAIPLRKINNAHAATLVYVSTFDPAETERNTRRLIYSLIMQIAQAIENGAAVKHERAALRLSEDLLTNVLLISDESVLICRTNGQIILMNHAAYTLFGLKVNENVEVCSQAINKSNVRLNSLIASETPVNNLQMDIFTAAGAKRCLVSTRMLTTSAESGEMKSCIVKIQDTNFEPNRPIYEPRTSLRERTFNTIIGSDPALDQAKETARLVAPTYARVLIQGETGTGRALLAKAIHNMQHADAPFVSIYCGSLTKEHFESDLFGTEKANQLRVGKIEQANNGTLFLDDIGLLPMEAQAKLLQFLDDSCIYRIGSSERINVTVRIIASSKNDLLAQTRDGRFLEELYFRVSGAQIRIPALRERPDDILPLVDYYITQFCETRRIKPILYTKEVRSVLRNYSWPGNVQQLKVSVKFACDVCKNSVISVQNLPPDILDSLSDGSEHFVASAPTTLKESERTQIVNALRECDNNITRTAAMLGIGRSTLYKKIKQYKIGRKSS